MKLIVAGSTGFVGTEVVRQALANPAITSVIALARRSTPVPDGMVAGADPSKLKPVVCDDFEAYSESVMGELAGADACIWLLAVTPAKLKSASPEQVRKICLDYTTAGLRQMSQLRRGSTGKPLRFLYISGSNAERDHAKKPWILGDYSLMRGNIESCVLDFAKGSNGAVEACVAKPGLINSPSTTGMMTKAFQMVLYVLISLPSLDVSEMAAALLNQAFGGFQGETLLNADLVKIGQRALAEEKDQSAGS